MKVQYMQEIEDTKNTEGFIRIEAFKEQENLTETEVQLRVLNIQLSKIVSMLMTIANQVGR